MQFLKPITFFIAILALSAGALAETDPHAAHRKAMTGGGQSAGLFNYELTGLAATDMQGNRTDLLGEVQPDRTVMLNFIFTSCTTICPVQSATFAHVQHMLGDEASDVTMISVSIDPEYDTPERMSEYAKQFRAGPQWQFLTGSHDEMVAIQRAFNAYSGSKMSHQPLTLIRGAGREDWLRIDGMASAKQIIDEYRKLQDDNKG